LVATGCGIVKIHFWSNPRWWNDAQIGRICITITQPLIAPFHSNMMQSLNTLQLIYYTNVQG